MSNTTNPFPSDRDPKAIAQDIINRHMPHPLQSSMVVLNAALDHRKLVCTVVTIQHKRAWLSSIFKTWGTPEEIAAKVTDINVLSQSPSAPSVFFPCPTAPENQSSLDVL